MILTVYVESPVFNFIFYSSMYLFIQHLFTDPENVFTVGSQQLVQCCPQSLISFHTETHRYTSA